MHHKRPDGPWMHLLPAGSLETEQGSNKRMPEDLQIHVQAGVSLLKPRPDCCHEPHNGPYLLCR